MVPPRLVYTGWCPVQPSPSARRSSPPGLCMLAHDPTPCFSSVSSVWDTGSGVHLDRRWRTEWGTDCYITHHIARSSGQGGSLWIGHVLFLGHGHDGRPRLSIHRQPTVVHAQCSRCEREQALEIISWPPLQKRNPSCLSVRGRSRSCLVMSSHRAGKRLRSHRP